jgi:hypothetical protein
LRSADVSQTNFRRAAEEKTLKPSIPENENILPAPPPPNIRFSKPISRYIEGSLTQALCFHNLLKCTALDSNETPKNLMKVNSNSILATTCIKLR